MKAEEASTTMTDEQRSFEVPAGRIVSVAPGLPCTDMARTVEHYRRLGFTFSFPGASGVSDAGFAIAERDGVELHFAVKRDHDPARTAMWIYLRVQDADALAAELAAELAVAGAGQDRPVRDTDYFMRELAHIDPDGNLLLFGSPLPRQQATSEQKPPARESGGPESGGSESGEPESGERESGGPESGEQRPGEWDPRETESRANQPRADQAAAYASRERQSPVPADTDRVAFELLAAIKRGDAGQLSEILAADPGLACCWSNGLTPLHHFADAPGHRANAVAVVAVLAAAGADLNAHARDSGHHETPLHWAASNDDVALIDALVDAGADIEHPGSSIGGGPPIQSALGYAQWAAVRRLWERGARIGLAHAAVLGEMQAVMALVEVSPAPAGDEISVAFWNACRAGQLATAGYLLAHGADPNWAAPWDGSTPLDAATGAHQREAVAWLRGIGAQPGSPG